MQPAIWKLPIELNKQEEQIASRIRRKPPQVFRSFDDSGMRPPWEPLPGSPQDPLVQPREAHWTIG
jgi:hypothetical protein